MTRRVWITLLVIIAIGLGFRLYKLTDRSLWTDEIATIASANGNSIDPAAYTLRGQSFEPATPQPAQFFKAKATERAPDYTLAKTAEVLTQNIHPPGFFGLMAVWLSAFPPTPFWLRILPVIFGLACVPLMFAIGNRLQDWRLGLLSAAMFAFSAYQVSHAQDARQYSLITLLALISIWLVLAPRKRMWLYLTLLTAAGVYCQYLYALFAVFVYGFSLTRYHWKPVLLSALGAVALFLPWLPSMAQQSEFLKEAGHYTAGLWDPLQLPELLWRTLVDFLFSKQSSARILLLVLFGYGLWTIRRWDQTLTVCLLWLAVILLGQSAIDLIKDSHTVSIHRYTLLAAPAFTLLFSWVLLNIKFPDVAKTALCILVVILTMTNTINLLSHNKFVSDDFKSTANYINTHQHPGDLVLIHKSGAILVGLAYYLDPTINLYPLPPGEGGPQGRVRARRVWLAFCHSSPSVQTQASQALEKQGYHLAEEPKKFPGIRLFLYALKE